MSSGSREIKRRIKSVGNIAQITKAMELVAASKMRKAQAQTLASRPYAQVSGALIRRLAKKSTLFKHPLLNKPNNNRDGKMLAIVISSDKGLAGALNTNLFNKAINLLKAEGREKFDFITVGKKSADMVRRQNLNLIAAFPGKDRNITILDARPVAEMAINDFLQNKYAKLFVIYTDFISTLNQKPNVLQLLPFVPEAEETDNDYVFEPDADAVLDKALNNTVEFILFQCMTEAAASEHSSRMVAMRNANEAAGELIDDLSLSFNQARQAGITKELSEISAAKLAMEQ